VPRMRYFAAYFEPYEAARAALDAAYGYPDAYTVTSIPVPDSLPRDSQGRVCVSVDDILTDAPAAASLIAQSKAAGVVEEIDETTFCDVCAAYYPQCQP